MQTVHITTTKFKAALLSALANIFGATVTREKSDRLSLRQVIDEGEADFAAGRGKTFTIEELENMVNEHA